MANIQIIQNNQKIGEVTLKEDETRIGRNPDSEICLQQAKVSGAHARVRNDKGAYWLEDLDSTNGTYVGGKKITQPYRLHHGDQIAIGEYTLKFITVGSEEKSARVVEGKLSQAESTMMINAGQLSDILGAHELKNAAKQGKVTGWLTIQDTQIPLSRSEVILGKAKTADVRVSGFFAPAISAWILRTREGFVLRPHRRGKVALNGGAVFDDTVLKNGDRIQIRSVAMTFMLKRS